jgi:hypothetical protein
MTISSVGGTAQSYLSQLFSAQQVQAASAVSVDAPADASTGTSAAPASNSLTGTGSSTLDSQTLQALLDLTQQADPSQQTGQTGQAQGTHHRHHHHGGGGMSSNVSSTTTTASASDTLASAAANGVASDAENTDTSLESALLAA